MVQRPTRDELIALAKADPEPIADLVADSAWKCASQLLKKMADGVRLSRHLRGLVFNFDSTSRI